MKQGSFDPGAATPLAGLKVFDLSRLVAGNMLSLQLADYGADVVKVEDPRKGDPLRAWKTQGHSLHWKVYGRNKRSLALDLRAPAGLELMRGLLAGADVLIENFRPGTLERMGLAPADLHRANPRLIIVRVSGFGQDGPYRERPGFGTLVEAMSGFAAMNGFADREPVLPPLALADMIAGLYGAFAVVVARREVERGGAGQVIDLPLLDPIISILGPQAAQFRVSGEIPKRTGSRSQTTSPRNTFRTRDGRWIAISASIQAMSERLFRTVGRPDMIDDPRFRTNTDRVRNVDDCEAPVAAFIAARDFVDVMALFERAEITAAPVYDIDQLIDDPHVAERGILVEMPDAELGHVAMHNVVPRLSATPGALRMAAPELGADSAAVLKSVGVDEAGFAKLVEAGIVARPDL